MDDTAGRVSDPAVDLAAERSAAQHEADGQATPRTDEIRQEIAETREEIAGTIDAIQEKLRPRNIVASATERVKTATTERVRAMATSAGDTAETMMERTKDTAGGVMEAIRDNPIPAAMIGVGAAWLLSSGSFSRRSYGTDSGYSDYRRRSSYGNWGGADSERDRGGFARQPEDSAENLTSRAREYAEETGDKIRRSGRRAQNQFQRMMTGNPLLVGAGALLLGAAFGLAVPETDRENELMGETRDAVMDRAQQMASDAATKLQETATNVADAAGGVADAATPRQG